MPLSLTTRWSGDIPIVGCRGRIVEGPESVALREHLEKELAQQSVLVLDLGGVDFIDSSGLGLLVKFAMRVMKDGGELKLCGVAPRIQTTLKTTKVNTVLSKTHNTRIVGTTMRKALVHSLNGELIRAVNYSANPAHSNCLKSALLRVHRVFA